MNNGFAAFFRSSKHRLWFGGQGLQEDDQSAGEKQGEDNRRTHFVDSLVKSEMSVNVIHHDGEQNNVCGFLQGT